MIHRSLRISSILVATLCLALAPSLSFAQATSAPTTPEAAPVPAPAVAPTPAPAPAPAVNTPSATPPEASGPRPATYTLQSGDTLESVGKQWGLTGRQLQRYNHLTNHQVRRLQIGAVIKVPPAK